MANGRTRSAAIPRSFAQGIRGSAAMPCCLTNPRAQRQARLDRVRRAARRRSRGRHQRRLILPSCVFEMRCVAWCSKIRADGGRAGATTAALVRTDPSSSAAEAVSRCRLRDANSAAARPATPDLQGLPQSMGEGRVPARIEGWGLNGPRQPRPAECCAILGYEFTGVKVSGCGTGHMHCGGQTGR